MCEFRPFGVTVVDVGIEVVVSPVVSADCKSVEFPPFDFALATLRERSLHFALVLPRGEVSLFVFTTLAVCAVSEDIVEWQDEE